jgi:hypothetical protein
MDLRSNTITPSSRGFPATTGIDRKKNVTDTPELDHQDALDEVWIQAHVR